MKRAALACLIAVPLSACSSGGDADYRQLFSAVRQGFSTSFGSGAVTLKQAAAIPYASMGWRWNGSPENIIILATDTNGDQLWTSAAHAVLLTQDGRIKRTVGLPQNLGALSPASAASLPAPAQAIHAAYSDRRVADFPDIGAFNVAINCRTRVAGRQAIKILGKAISTVRIIEDCDSPSQNWHFANTFWVDPESGLVWRSRQHIHPGDAMIETETLRPPG